MENILEVYVTREDLKQPYIDPCNYPITTAIKRTYPELDVLADTKTVHIWNKAYGIGNGAVPVYQYSLRPEDDNKAQMRGDGKLLGKLLGGFKVVLHKIHWT